MKMLKLLFISFLLVFGFWSAAYGYNLTLKVTSDGVNAKTLFDRGDTLVLVIGVDNAKDVAGAALTLVYPSNVLDAPVIDAAGLSTGIDSPFPFLFIKDLTATKTYRGNVASGQLYLSGAAIDTTTGGGIESGTVTGEFFTVVFTVNSSAAVGTYNFTIEQTQLWNPQAGYGKDSFGNDVPTTQTTMTAGDQEEAVPVLVGAKSMGDSGYANYSSTCEGMTGDCAFPILLGGPTTPFLGVNQSFDVGIPGDSDNDTILDSVEIANGTNPFDQDTDGDGYPDANDLNPLIQDPADSTNPFYNELLDVRVSNLDIDGDGFKTGSVDGIILLRYMYGFAPQDLLTGLTINGPRDTAQEVTDYIDKVGQVVYDIDGSATVSDPKASVDGIMILRYLYGFATDDLILGIEDLLSGPRTDPAVIKTYLDKIGTP